MTTATKARRLFLTLLGAVVLAATLTVAGFAASAKADYTLSLSPASQSVNAGTNATYVVTMTPNNGYAGTVTLAANLQSSNASGAAATFTPATVNSKNPTSTLTVSTPASAVGNWTLMVAASDNTHATSQASLTVKPAPAGFSLAATPPSVQLLPGDTAQYGLSVTRSGYTGTVALSVTGLPSGATSSFSPVSPVAGNSTTLQVTTGSTTPSGTFTLQISGSGGTTTQSTNVQLVVSSQGKPFQIAGGPASSVKLYPGPTTVPIQLALSNPNNQDVNVTNITVTVTGTDQGSACGPENYSVTQMNSLVYPLVLPKNASNMVVNVPQNKLPTIQMLDLNRSQDLCKNAKVFLSFTGAGNG